MNQYYIFQNEEQKGPFTISQLKMMWGTGAITTQTLYWQDGFSEWRPLSEIIDEIEPSPSSVSSTADLSNSVEVPQPKTVNEVTLWTGHPSHWNYFWSWVLGVLLLAAFGLGLLIIIWIYFDRARRVYTVTNRKVIFQSGIFVKSTNEIRIKDIRSVNVSKRGLGGFIGIGSVEFSSAATDRADIIFLGISGADDVRDIVRKLQD